MIGTNYPLSSSLAEKVSKFRTIFNLTHDQFTLACIGLVLSGWKCAATRREIEPEYVSDEHKFRITLPPRLTGNFSGYCMLEDFTPPDCVNGMIGLVIDYLEGAWDGDDHKDSATYGIDSTDMTDAEKRKLLFASNVGDDFNKFFAA